MPTREYLIVQNPMLGAFCLWSFARQYRKARGDNARTPLWYCFVVLPIVFHRETVSALYSRRFSGGLLNALAEDRGLPVGVQERMEDMADQTFEALRLGAAARILSYDNDTFSVRAGPLTEKDIDLSSECRRMMKTAARLGFWFATMPLDQICTLLRIRF